MDYSYLLVLFFLFGTGVDANRSNNPGQGKHEVYFHATVQRHGNSSMFVTNFGMTPNQLYDLEDVLNQVVNRFLGAPKRKLSLRSSDNENTGIMYTITSIGDAIYRQIIRLFEAFGLISPTQPESSTSSKPDVPDLKSTVYHQLLSIPLRLAPYWQVAQKHLNNHFQKKNYQKMGYKKAKFDFQLGHAISTDQLKISAIGDAMAKYGGHFYDCLESKQSSSFDLKRTVGKLTNFSPEVTGRRLRTRLEKQIPKCPNKNKEEYNQYHAFACRALVDNSRRDFYECLGEIKRIDNCVYKMMNKSGITNPAVKSAKSFKAFQLDLKNLQNICKNPDQGIGILVDCKLKSKTKRRNVFPDMINFFVGDTKKSPKLRRMANKIGSMITKSRMGSETLNEIATLIEIYKNGLKKKTRLMKAAEKDPRQRSLFGRISNALMQYKQYILDVTYKTVLHVNTAMTTVQKILVESASTLVGQDLAPNFRTFKSWSSWMESVVIEWSHERSYFPTSPISNQKMNLNQSGNNSVRSRSKNLIKVPNEVGFIKNSHEEPLNELIVSMKSLGRPNKPRRTNAIVSLANTFLLATMFYECISLLAGAIYQDDSSSMSSINSAENDDGWQSSRDKRSSPPINPEEFRPQGENEQMEPLWSTTKTSTSTVATVKPDDESTKQSMEDWDFTEMANAEEAEDLDDIQYS